MNGGEVIFKFLGDDKGLKKTMGALGSIGKTALAGVVAGTTAVATGFTAMVKASVDARGEFEQLEGGVNKIFGKDAQKVMDNANKAFKTAGVSANQYMTQVTSFSSSLIQSLGGDTEKASEIANRAIIDMADNANTFGSSMESIQNAYQGFAKQNYTMLDNLKLGYGGTKTEMQRLIKDASKMKDVQKELNVQVKDGDMSFANIANAISVMQKNLKVAGTTEKEATETLTGSMASFKSAWQNFLAGTGDMGQVVQTASTAFKNVIRIVEEAIPYMVDGINEFMPELINCGKELIGAIGKGLMDNLPSLMKTASEIVGQLASAFVENLPQILDVGIDIILELIDGLTEAMPELVPKAVEVINKLIVTLIDHAPELTEAGFKLLLAVAEGIIKSIPNQIEGIWQILTAIDSQIKGFFENMKQNGYEMLKRFCEGLGINLDLVRQRIEAIKNIIKIGIMYLKNSASNWGSDFVQGFADGIMNRLYHLGEVVNRMANSIRSRLHFSKPDERTIT